jgi:hypothetical protein
VVKQAQELALDFLKLIRERLVDKLREWLIKSVVVA